MRFSFNLLIIWLLAIPATGQALTLNESVSLAIQSNPIARTLEADVDSSKARLKQTGANRHPQISISTEQGSSRSSSSGWAHLTQSSVRLKQLVYDFQKTARQIESSQKTLDSKQFQLKEGRQRLALLVSKAFLEVLKLDRILILIDNNIVFYEQLLSVMRTREKAGASTFSDVQRIVSLLQSARQSKITYLSDSNFAKEAFTLIVGAPPVDLQPPLLEKLTLAQSQQAVLKKAKQDYFGVLVKKYQMESAHFAFKKSLRDLYPDITLEASVVNEQSLKTQNNWNTDQRVALVLSYDLWDGKRTRHKSDESRSQLMRSRYQMEDYLKTLERDIREAFSTMQRLKEEKVVNAKTLDVNRQIVELYKKEFDLGQKNLIDITTAQGDYHKSRVDSVYFYYEYYSSLLSVMFYLNNVTRQVSQL